MKTMKLLPVFTKSTNVIVILMMILSQLSWGVTRAAADTLNPPVIMEGSSTSAMMSQNGSPQPFDLTLHATGAGTLVWSITTPASHGAASASGTGASKVIGYTPDIDYTGSDSFVVQVNDGNGGIDTITVDVNISPYSPIAVAFISQNGVTGFHWVGGAQVTLTITGAGPDYTETQTSVGNPTDPWDTTSTKVDFQLTGFVLLPGQVITMTDAITTKTLTVADLNLGGGNAQNDTIWGTAEPGAVIDIVKQTDHNIFRRETADGLGNWLADFSIQGDEAGEDPYIIKPGDILMVMQGDDDGDHTQTDWRAPNPYIEASPSNNWVHGREWPNGTPLTLTIDDPSNGAGIDETVNATMGQAPWNPGNPSDIVADFNLDGFDLQPGQLLEITDGSTARTYTPTDLVVTGFDTGANVVSGTAADGEVHIWVNGGPDLNIPVAGGHWTANFSPYDLVPAADGSAQQSDVNGNQTWVDWKIPNPRFSAQFPWNEVHGYEWPLGASLTLTIDDPGNGVGVDYTQTKTVDMENFKPPSDTWIGFRLGAFQLSPGQLITMTDGTTTKTHIVQVLTVTQVDAQADTITGTAAPGSGVGFGGVCDQHGCVSRYVLADNDGNWIADFSVPVNESFDLRPGSSGEAQRTDADGDATVYQWRVLSPYIEANPDGNWVHAREWPNGTPLTLTIDDPSNGVGIDKTVNASMGPAPWNPDDPNDIVADFNLDGFDLQAGQLLEITDGVTARNYTLANLAVTGFDLDAEMISGIATPGMEVQICANIPNNCISRYVTVDGSGNWIADYAHPGPRDDEKRLVDLQSGTDGWAVEQDVNGNRTQVDWHIPAVHAFYLKASAVGNWVHAYGWMNGAELTLAVDRPGVGGDVDYTTTVNASQAPWDVNSPLADIIGVFDLGSNYNLQPGDELTVSGASHTETYTIPGGMTQVRWFIGLGTGSDPGQLPAEQQAVDGYNLAHPGIELIVEVQPNNSARAALTAQIAAGHAPDVVGPVGWAGSNAFQGQWLDLAPLIASTSYDLSQFNPALIPYYQTEEGQVGLPFAVYPAVIYYQKGMFDAAGLNYPPAHYGDQYDLTGVGLVAWNFDTMTQVARLLTLDNTGKNATQPGFDKNNIVQYGFVPQWQNTTALATFWGADTLYAGTPGNYTAAIPNQWAAAWRWYYDGMWGNQPFIPNNSTLSTPEYGSNAFNSGKVAMALTEAWYTCCMNEAGSNWDLAALPAYNGSVHGLIHADTFRILDTSTHPDEAFDVLTYLIGDASQTLLSAYGGLPGRTADQAAYFANRSAQFPWVTHWDVMQAGLNYPDIPNNEAWMPNYDQAFDRLQVFGGQLAGSGSVNMDNELVCLQTDLQRIFNNQPTQGCANFSVRFPENEVHGYQWPLGASVTLTIDDPGTPQNPDYTDTQTVIVAPWDSNQTWVRFAPGIFALEPGQLVSMADGTTTKTHTVTTLAVTAIDPVADTVAGTAAPGSQVDVGQICDQNGCAFRRVTTDGSGHWLADFSVVGEDDDEKDLFDIRPGIGNEARQPDEDGDTTNVQWRLLNPYIEANPGSYWLHAREWPNGAELTLTIDDPGLPPTVDYTTTATMGPAPWNPGDPNDIVADFNLNDFNLEAGQVVKVTDGTTERTYTLTNLAITGFDAIADTISGIAVPGVEVQVCANMPGNCVSRYVTPDGTGHWTVDYAHPGARDDEQQLVDLQPGKDGWAAQRDANGSQTWADWRMPTPRIYASPDNNWVQAVDWPNGTLLTLTINDSDSFTATTGPDLLAQFDLGAYDLQPGDKLFITDGGAPAIELEYHPVAVAITGFDLDADTVSGTATPGMEVQVEVDMGGWVSRFVTADGAGYWTADYAHPGPRDDEQKLVDVQPGSHIWLTEYDANRNLTWTDRHVPNPNLNVRANTDQVGANQWPLGNILTLEIDDPGTPQNPDYTDTQIAGVNPKDPNQTYAEFNIQSVFDIQPGFVVSISDGVTTKTHTVTGLRFTSIDLDNDLVYGVADPNVRVDVWACDTSNCYNRHATSNGSGDWMVDFSAPGSEGNEQVIFDLVDGTWIDSNQAGDTDGDTTMFGVTVSVPTISDIGNQSTDEDTATGPITFTIGDPETPVDSLMVTAVSSNSALVPNGNITLGGSGRDRTITLTPTANQSGTSIITINVDDGLMSTSDSFVLTVNPVNDAPGVVLSHTTTSLRENANTSAAIKVADITITDDALGTNVLSLSGPDAALFEIAGSQLRLKAGAVLDFETNPVLNVTVAVDDSSVGATPDDTDALTITLIDFDEIRPSVVSSLRANPNPSAASKVNFTVTFSESVIGVGNADFSLHASGVTGASISSVSGSGKTYTVAVNTGSGNGTIRLDLPVSATITDLFGNRLVSLPYTGGQSYTINKTLTINSTDTQDGWVLESSENSNKGGTMNPVVATINLGDDPGKRQYLGILSFSTGFNLPDNAVITGVTLKVQKQGVIGGGDPLMTFQGFMVDIKNGFFGTAALQTSDFQTPADKSYGPFKPTPVSNWYSIDLTSAKTYINKSSTGSGLTQIRLRFKLDDNNNAVANYLSLYSGNAPAASRPQLIIQYYVPVP